MIPITDFLSPDGNTDNAPFIAALLADMAVNPGETYTAKRGQTYLINGPVSFPSNVRMRLEGARFDLGASLSSSGCFMAFGDGADIDVIDTRVRSGFTAPRCVNLGHGSRVSEVVAKSDDQQANTGALLHAAVRVIGSDSSVGFIDVENFDQSVMVYGDANVSPNIDSALSRVRMRSYKRGLDVRNCERLTVLDTAAIGRSPNATPDPGQNAILIEGAKDCRFLGGVLADAGEHGFRSGGFRDLAAGLPHAVATSGLIVSDFLIRNSGQSGFKIWASTAQVHKDIGLSNIQVLDCGDDGDGLGFNDEGFMLQSIDGIRGSNLTASRRDLSFSALDGFYLHGITNGKLDGVSAIGAQRNSIRVSEFSDDQSLDPMSINTLNINGALLSSHGADGVYFNFPGASAIRDVMMPGTQIIGGVNGFGGSAAASRYKQPCYFSASVRGNSGVKFSLPVTSNIKTLDLAA